MPDRKRQLLWHGVLLFLLGLIVGFIHESADGTRRSLGRPDEWDLPHRVGGEWTEIITSFATVFGTAAMPPITASGHRGQPWQEHVVKFGFASVAIAIVIAVTVFLWGLRRNAHT